MHWFQPAPTAARHYLKAIAAHPPGASAADVPGMFARVGHWVLAFLWRWSLPLIVFCVAFIPRWALAHSLDIVTDEGVYIPDGRIDVLLLLRGLFQNSHWLDNYEAPALPKLIMGTGSLLASRSDPVNGALFGARIPAVLLCALALAAAYVLARPIFGRVPSLVGVLALALSPWVAFFSSIAYLDSFLMDFVMLAILLTWHAARRPWLLPVVGVLLALGFDSKYTAAFALLPVGLYLAYYYAVVVRHRPPWQLLLLPVAGMATLYAADPSIWVEPVGRLSNSILFQWNHAADGHNVFWNGVVYDHVPPGEVLFIIFAKMSLFLTIPATLALGWSIYRLIRARRAPRHLDDRAAFVCCWLGVMMLPFGLLNIVVGTHYMLPLAPAVAFAGAWAMVRGARWLGPRLALWGWALWQRLRAWPAWPAFAALTKRDRPAPALPTRAARTTGLAALTLACLLLTVPPAYGLATVPQAEGYTSEWLKGENASLQVAYPGYMDGVDWVTNHTQGRVTVTLVARTGSLDYWLATRQPLFPDRIRLRTLTPEDRAAGQSNGQPIPPPVSNTEYVIWPAHLVQRGFATLPNWHKYVVATIGGGGTVYCYILAVPKG